MWADAQRDGRPVEYRWRSLRKLRTLIPFLVSRRKVWLTPAAGVPCSNAEDIGEGKTWTQSEFCTWHNSVRGQEVPRAPKVHVAQQTKHEGGAALQQGRVKHDLDCRCHLPLLAVSISNSCIT